jgi:hypothetical protein
MILSLVILTYNFFLIAFVPYIVTNATRLGISAGQVTTLTGYLTTWTTTFAAYVNPLTHGKITIGEINVLFGTVFKFTSSMKQQIKNNSSVSLSETDYAVLDIHKDAIPRKSINTPQQESGNSLRKSTHLANVFDTFDIDNPTKRGKPDDVAKVGVKLLARAIGVPPLPFPVDADLVRMPNSGSMKLTLNFLAAQVGFEAFLSTCFINEKGEEGTWSEIFPFTII